MADLYYVGFEKKAEAICKFAHTECFFGSTFTKAVVDMVQSCRALGRMCKERKCGRIGSTRHCEFEVAFTKGCSVEELLDRDHHLVSLAIAAKMR